VGWEIGTIERCRPSRDLETSPASGRLGVSPEKLPWLDRPVV